ncbi:BQ2448_2461 [Microbotryum intermedium]|uniref:BQ2448_2461 protein n=1 Tax=Microbotryum intermedium TaxID=269621 RepID=A0A238FBH0_9BASI|nr:BQ2448_2461 [Microbotryum intermedium]
MGKTTSSWTLVLLATLLCIALQPSIVEAGGVVAARASDAQVQHHVQSSQRRGAAAALTGYSALIAFGASYVDNAHPRAEAYKGSIRDYYPYSAAGGRCTNGPVEVEHMVASSTAPVLKAYGNIPVKLVDYAYGGSVIRNGLGGTSSSYPATRDQIAAYVSDLKRSRIDVGKGRVLHFFNTGINPVTQIWLKVLESNMSTASVNTARNYVKSNSAALGEFINSTSKSVNGTVAAADFLIVGIPPLEVVPTFGYQIPSTYTASQRAQAFSILKELSVRFNSDVKSFASSFKSQVPTGSKMFYYDLAALWKDMTTSPSKYGITVTDKPCYNSTSGAVCTNPTKYIYFDTLHPVTSVHKIWAIKMNTLVNSS